MIVHQVLRLAVARRRALVMAAALVAMFAIVSPALATENHPTGEYAPFAECPLSNTAVQECLLANTTSGEFVVGKKTVPINKTITLQGGLHETNTGALEFFGAENGDTLSKTELTVPGGLLGIVAPKTWPEWLQNLFNEFIDNGFTGVKEITELAAPATDIGVNTENLLEETGVALSLPVKVKLINVLLGKECYVGSEAEPIKLELTTGTTTPPEKGTPNKPIKGAKGTPSFNSAFTIFTLSGGSLVDNTFAAPGASGCGEGASALVDPLVDSILGVPAASGYNTAILTGKLQEANAVAVKASE
jgi:hypothetical protein